MTPRGSVKAKQVVFATNAYSQALVPEMKDLIVPTRGKRWFLVVEMKYSWLIMVLAQALKLSTPPNGLDKFPRIEGS